MFSSPVKKFLIQLDTEFNTSPVEFSIIEVISFGKCVLLKSNLFVKFWNNMYAFST